MRRERWRIDPGRQCGRTREHGEDRTDPQQQVATGAEQRPHAVPTRPPVPGGANRRRITTTKATPAAAWATTVDHAVPGEAHVERVHERERENEVDDVGGEQDHERCPIVGRAPLDALGPEGDEHEGDAERGDTQVLDGGVVDGTVGTEQRS